VPVEKSGIRNLEWRKARRSVGNGACVELATANGQIIVRDSVNPGGAWLRYPVQSWVVFATKIKDEIIFE